MVANRQFHWVDYAIFVTVLLISTAIGLYHAISGGRQRTTKEYLLANKHLRTIPVALSILVSFVSAILVLGTPAEMYTRGAQLTLKTIGYCFACVISSVFFVPLFYSLKINSAFEYLQLRFRCKLVRLMGTVSMIVSSVFYMSLVIYTPATAIEAATGFPLWSSVLACGMVATIYTTLGGMKAVVWTDTFQAIVMIIGLIIIFIVGTLRVGGLTNMWRINREDGRLVFFNFSLDLTQRLSFWSLVIGGCFNTLVIFGIGQASIQRYCSLPSLREAKRSVFLNVPCLLLINVLVALVGFVVYAYYASIECDPLRQGYISNANQLVPYFMVDVLNFPGFPGIFLAVLFGGALSSLSSALNSVTTVMWEDIVKDFFSDFSEGAKANVAKCIVFSYGCLAIGLSFLAQNLGGHVLQLSLSFTGATSGPSLGLFLLGSLFPVANKKGAIAGFLVSMSLSLWIVIGAFTVKPYHVTLPTNTAKCDNNSYANATTFLIYNTTDLADGLRTMGTNQYSHPHLEGLNKLYGISFLWYCTIGTLLTIAVGLLVSYFTKSCDKVDPELIIPVRKRLLCCLPASWCCYLQAQTDDQPTSSEMLKLPADHNPEVNTCQYNGSHAGLLAPSSNERLH